MCLSAAVLLSCLALAAQAQIAQQPTTRPEDLCTIEGSVTNAATGAPVKKATILMMLSDVTPRLTRCRKPTPQRQMLRAIRHERH